MVVDGGEREVVDEVSGWLRVYDDGSVDRTWVGPPEVKFMVEPVPAHENFIDGVAVRDVIINDRSSNSSSIPPEAGQARRRVRIYLPELASEAVVNKDSDRVGDHHPNHNNNKLPIILHMHGGGFCISRADWYMYYSAYTNLARTAGAIVVSVYLPVAPEHRLPAAIDDSFSALLWLKSLAAAARFSNNDDQQFEQSDGGDDHDESWLSAYGDFSRVFLIGDSSGGNLVHEVAVRAGRETSEMSPLRLAGAIPIHPGFCRAQRSRSELEMPQSPFLTLDMADKFLQLALPAGSTKDHPITCPMGTAAPAMSSLKLPPIMLCVAGNDLMIDTEMEYYEAMKEAGKDIELFASQGMTHSFYLNKIAVDKDPSTKRQTQELFQMIAEFIKRH